ncbi:hypothetical protein BASA83_013622 [Batrachochytrium salamandrivorans]|nr:hypothetical protein BASA83_013622 [Batrachochytrium salamandrivorans]
MDESLASPSSYHPTARPIACPNHQEPSYQESTRTTSHKLPYQPSIHGDTRKLTDQVYPYIGSSDSISGNFPTCLIKEFQRYSTRLQLRLYRHLEHDFAIDLEPGFKPPHGKVYSLTTPETVAMNEYFAITLKKDLFDRQNHPRQLHVSSLERRTEPYALFKTTVASMLEPSRTDIDSADI